MQVFRIHGSFLVDLVTWTKVESQQSLQKKIFQERCVELQAKLDKSRVACYEKGRELEVLKIHFEEQQQQLQEQISEASRSHDRFDNLKKEKRTPGSAVSTCWRLVWYGPPYWISGWWCQGSCAIFCACVFVLGTLGAKQAGVTIFNHWYYVYYVIGERSSHDNGADAHGAWKPQDTWGQGHRFGGSDRRVIAKWQLPCFTALRMQLSGAEE